MGSEEVAKRGNHSGESGFLTTCIDTRIESPTYGFERESLDSNI